MTKCPRSFVVVVVVALLICVSACQQSRRAPSKKDGSTMRNVALGKPVTASSESPAHPARGAVDGVISRTSKWEAATGRAPHVLEVDLQKYCAIEEIRVHSGIVDAEKRANEMTQAAGFWSLKN